MRWREKATQVDCREEQITDVSEGTSTKLVLEVSSGSHADRPAAGAAESADLGVLEADTHILSTNCHTIITQIRGSGHGVHCFSR